VGARDGRRRGSSDLLERAASRFGDPSSFPAVFYARGDRAAALASFAPDVIAAAQAGDAVAAGIVAAAGTHLAEAAAAAMLPGEAPLVAYAGGLFAAGEPLLEPLRAALAELAPDAVLTAAAGSALDGAVALARLAATSPGAVPDRPPYIWTIQKEPR
jgi:N-acetylglucosamine kinase-like BadF-type ATPase